MPEDTIDAPCTVFTDRFWDVKEGWTWDGIGTVPDSLVPYLGTLPQATLGPIEGSATEFQEGLLYSEWISGQKVSALPCVPFTMPLGSCSCSAATVTKIVPAIADLNACSCSAATVTKIVPAIADLNACSCSAATVTKIVPAIEDLNACSCSAAELQAGVGIRTFLFGCSCSSADATFDN